MTTFGDRLRDARTKAGLKQSDVAARLDCAPTSLTNWENGKVQPSLDVLSKLCAVYGISPLSLLGRKYEYSDIVAIAGKPVTERAYEEQVALNFSETILDKLLIADAERRETARVEETAAFIRQTDLLNRFGGIMNQKEIEAVKAEFDENGGADSDILFAFHALTDANKAAFLSMLCGLLSDGDNLRSFNDRMDKAAAFTLDRLTGQRTALKQKQG